MKKRKRIFWMLGAALLIMLQLQAVQVSAAAAAQQQGTAVAAAGRAAGKSGLVREGKRYFYYYKRKRLISRWKTIGKDKYYFGERGYAVTPSVILGGKTYVFDASGKLLRPKKKSIVKSGKYYFYVDKYGQAATGWFTLNNKLYRADPKGRLYANRSYEGVTFTKTGAAKSSTASKLKLRTQMVVNSITNSKMSKSQKLRACWNYVTSTRRFRYWNMTPDLDRKGWHKEFALNMLNTYRGSCSSFACAFAALASQVGYRPYIIYGRVPGSRDGAWDGYTRHCWVKIDGRHYDPDAEFAGWARGIYGTWGYPMDYMVTTSFNFEKGN